MTRAIKKILERLETFWDLKPIEPDDLVLYKRGDVVRLDFRFSQSLSAHRTRHGRQAIVLEPMGKSDADEGIVYRVLVGLEKPGINECWFEQHVPCIK